LATGNADLRCDDSVSITAHADARTTTITRITSTVGFVKNFQIFCQFPLLDCIR